MIFFYFDIYQNIIWLFATIQLVSQSVKEILIQDFIRPLEYFTFYIFNYPKENKLVKSEVLKLIDLYQLSSFSI